MSIFQTVLSWLHVHLSVSYCPLCPSPGLSYLGCKSICLFPSIFYVHLLHCLFLAVCPSVCLLMPFISSSWTVLHWLLCPPPRLSIHGCMSISLFIPFISSSWTILCWFHVHLSVSLCPLYPSSGHNLILALCPSPQIFLA